MYILYFAINADVIDTVQWLKKNVCILPTILKVCISSRKNKYRLFFTTPTLSPQTHKIKFKLFELFNRFRESIELLKWNLFVYI